MRTCIGCRETVERNFLLRFVSGSSEVIVDNYNKLSGRGAWLHPRRDCLNSAIKREAFKRALKTSIIVDVKMIENRLNG